MFSWLRLASKEPVVAREDLSRLLCPGDTAALVRFSSVESASPVSSVPAVPYAVKVACLLCFGPRDWDIQSGLDPVIPHDMLHPCDVPFLVNSLRSIDPT